MTDENHQAIRDAIARVLRDTRWLVSADGMERIDDKGIKPKGILRDVIINILHQAKEAGFDPREIIVFATLLFAGECGTDSPEFRRLEDIAGLALQPDLGVKS